MTLQPRTLLFLNHVNHLDPMSNRIYFSTLRLWLASICGVTSVTSQAQVYSSVRVFSAVAGDDYIAAPLVTVIPASTVNGVCVNISVMVIDDTLVEFPQNFTIELTASTPPLQIGAASSTTVIIVDDDSEYTMNFMPHTVEYISSAHHVSSTHPPLHAKVTAQGPKAV